MTYLEWTKQNAIFATFVEETIDIDHHNSDCKYQCLPLELINDFGNELPANLSAFRTLESTSLS